MSLPPSPSRLTARLFIVAASVLWSLSGGFTKVLSQPTALDLDQPRLDPSAIALYRALFAALALAPTVRRADLSWRPGMLGMMACFAAMSVMFVRAMVQGTAANAIWLQYTAPLWLYLAGILWLGEPPDRRSTFAVLLGMVGVGVIVAANWDEGQLGVVALALGSGLTYAGVLVWLRVLRGAAPAWLTVLNHLGSVLVLLPALWLCTAPTAGQAVWLALFGIVQMALPYWLIARALRVVSPQEAGTLTLIEPLLNPVWAYLLSPATETPTWPTLAGAAAIAGALVVRYWPARRDGQER